MENIYDLTNFNLNKDPLLTFIVKTYNNETIIQCNDNIIGTYNQIVSEHDITDIINQLLYEKNIDIKNLCFIIGNSNYISIKTDNKTYNNINRNTVVKKFKTISLDFTGYSNIYCILKCFMINYKLDDMANYMNHEKINPKYAHIVSPPVYDKKDNNDNINVTLYIDLQNGSYNDHIFILYKSVGIKEKFIKNIKFASTDNKYIILCKLFEIHKDNYYGYISKTYNIDTYYRLYVCKIYNIDLDKSVNVCFFNNMNKFINSNGIIKIKEYDKYINILDNRIFIDLTEYKYYMHKLYINYTIDCNIEDS